MFRAYSQFNVTKDYNYDDDERVVEGVATSIATDRMGDVVVPRGIKFKTPFPLLYQHNHRAPVGSVTVAKVSDKDITVRAKLVKPEKGMPQALVDRLELAWHEVKAGLVRAFSIGFVPTDTKLIRDDNGNTTGYRFEESDLLELSLVTIPANAEATIVNIKSYDTGVALDSEINTAFGVPVVKLSEKNKRPFSGVYPLRK